MSGLGPESEAPALGQECRRQRPRSDGLGAEGLDVRKFPSPGTGRPPVVSWTPGIRVPWTILVPGGCSFLRSTFVVWGFVQRVVPPWRSGVTTAGLGSESS